MKEKILEILKKNYFGELLINNSIKLSENNYGVYFSAGNNEDFETYFVIVNIDNGSIEEVEDDDLIDIIFNK